MSNPNEALRKQAARMERIALGAILTDNEKFDTAGLLPTDFADPVNRQIFKIIAEHISAGGGMSPALLGYTTATESPIDDETTIADYAFKLADEAPQWTSSTFAVLRDLAARRLVHRLSKTLGATVTDVATPLTTVLDEITRQIDAIRSGATTRKWDWTFDESAELAIEEMLSDAKPETMTTGIRYLDRQLGGGFRRREFVIIGGRPSMGKSMVMQGMALRMARAGHGVILFTFEMGHDELMRRILTDIAFTGDSPIEYNRIQSKQLTDHEKYRIEKAREEWRNLPLVIVDRRGLSAAQIVSQTREQARRWEADGIRLGAMCVDHLGQVKSSDRYAGNKVNETGEVSAAMMLAASELDCVAFGAHQLNRGNEQRENTRPLLSDLRNSGDLEQDAHTVLLVHREAYRLERIKHDDPEDDSRRIELLANCRHEMEINIAKQRNGPTGIVQVYCNPGANVVRNWADYEHVASKAAALKTAA